MTEKRDRNIAIVYEFATNHLTTEQVGQKFGLSESRVNEIIWTFLKRHGYKPVLHPGRLSAHLVLRVYSREKLERLYDPIRQRES